MKQRAFRLALIFGLGWASAAIAAPNPLGFYVGASVGQSNVRTSVEPIGRTYDLDERNTGWKALVGLRPISLIAAELAYVDLGQLQSSMKLTATTLHANTRQRAATLSGLIFAPIPLPVLDLHVRAGVARLQSSGSASLVCNPLYLCTTNLPLYLRLDETKDDFLYGAGIQLKLAALAVRLEYERMNDGHGDPGLLSAGLLWTF